MARILITSGPTRQYLDPVRYLSNASSGRMGQCLATAAIERGHKVIVISGPVAIDYPPAATIVGVVSTDDMLHAAQRYFPDCDGVIAAAAPCDYQPQEQRDQKIDKTGGLLRLDLQETPDILGELGKIKQPTQWSVGFALQTDDAQRKALAKLVRKNCDLIVVNDASAIDSDQNDIQILDRSAETIFSGAGSKEIVASRILEVIETHLVLKSDEH